MTVCSLAARYSKINGTVRVQQLATLHHHHHHHHHHFIIFGVLLPHRRSTTVSLETTPFNLSISCEPLSISAVWKESKDLRLGNEGMTTRAMAESTNRFSRFPKNGKVASVTACSLAARYSKIDRTVRVQVPTLPLRQPGTHSRVASQPREPGRMWAIIDCQRHAEDQTQRWCAPTRTEEMRSELAAGPDTNCLMDAWVRISASTISETPPSSGCLVHSAENRLLQAAEIVRAL